MKEKDKSLRTPLGRLLKVGYWEGISFIVLLFVAMPLKYIFDMPSMVRIVGMLHGILFVMYAVALLKATMEYGWKTMLAFKAFLLSFLPFGTFYLEKMLDKN